MQIGYGSEWQLFRLFARHRKLWDAAVRRVLERDGLTGITAIEWEDFPFSDKTKTKDQEIKGMDFLPENLTEWKEFWPDPQAGDPDREQGVPTWDAVGRIHFANRRPVEWLLIEGKSHQSELTHTNACGAKLVSSIEKITNALEQTYTAMGCTEQPWATVKGVWVHIGCYQITNRLASLHFLRNVVGVPARLLFVYFLNDPYQGVLCPKSPSPWIHDLRNLYGRMGIPLNHNFKQFIHYFCMDVRSGQVHPFEDDQQE
jgi:hypothetical protein